MHRYICIFYYIIFVYLYILFVYLRSPREDYTVVPATTVGAVPSVPYMTRSVKIIILI